MRKLYVILFGILVVGIPSAFNACGVPSNLPSTSTPNSTIAEQNGGTTGNPLVPLRAIAYSLQRNYMGCFKGLLLIKPDGTFSAVNVVEAPTSINFTGTDFGAFPFPNGTYNQIRLVFVGRCINQSGNEFSFAMSNDHGDFVTDDSIVMRFDGNFTYPDSMGRHPVLDMTPIVLELEKVTSDSEIAPFARNTTGTFSLE